MARPKEYDVMASAAGEDPNDYIELNGPDLFLCGGATAEHWALEDGARCRLVFSKRGGQYRFRAGPLGDLVPLNAEGAPFDGGGVWDVAVDLFGHGAEFGITLWELGRVNAIDEAQ